MGRHQQITLLAAQIAHNTRREIELFRYGSCDVQTYDKLDDEKRTSVIRHTSLLIAGEFAPVDAGDHVAVAVANEIKEAEAEPLPPIHDETLASLDAMKETK